MTIRTGTMGRYWPGPCFALGPPFDVERELDRCLPAQVIRVNEDGTVNLRVYSPRGINTVYEEGVPLDSEATPDEHHFRPHRT